MNPNPKALNPTALHPMSPNPKALKTSHPENLNFWAEGVEELHVAEFDLASLPSLGCGLFLGVLEVWDLGFRAELSEHLNKKGAVRFCRFRIGCWGGGFL